MFASLILVFIAMYMYTYVTGGKSSMSEEVFEAARCYVGTDQDLIICSKRSSSTDISACFLATGAAADLDHNHNDHSKQ